MKEEPKPAVMADAVEDLMVEAESLLVAREPGEALISLNTALELDEQGGSVDRLCYLKGCAYMDLGRYEKALGCFERCGPDTGITGARLLALRGAVLERLGRTRQALDTLKEAAELDAGEPMAFYYQALPYLRLGLWPDAHRAVRTAMDLDPEEPNCWLYLGVVLEYKGTGEGALVIYDAILEAFPLHLETLKRKRDLLHDLERYEEARECTREIYDFGEDNWDESDVMYHIPDMLIGSTGDMGPVTDDGPDGEE